MQQLREWLCRKNAYSEWVPYDPRVSPYGRQIVPGETPQDGDFFVNDDGEIVKLSRRDNNFQFTPELMEEGRFFRPLAP